VATRNQLTAPTSGMSSSSEEGPAEPGLTSVGDSGGFEPLACTICRSRKLKVSIQPNFVLTPARPLQRASRVRHYCKPACEPTVLTLASKCDRTKPACTRCTKAGVDCLYPESRRKPAFKRRNVKELEERLGMFRLALPAQLPTTIDPHFSSAGRRVPPECQQTTGNQTRILSEPG